MPRYEFSEGTSNKFWEIELEGEEFTTRWGRIGVDGQSTTKEFDSKAKARAEYDKLIAEKVKKGYQLVVGDDDEPAVESKSNPQMEAAIAAAPDDPRSYLVYADWLQSQGDPRGELITVQHALTSADGAKAKELNARADALISEHGDAWLGPIAEAGELVKLTWQFGFVKTARLQTEYDGEFVVEDGLTWLVKSPVGRFLQELTIGHPGGDGNIEFQGMVDTIVSLKPPALRSLFIGDFESEECEISWSDMGKTKDLYAALPKLEKLILRAGKFDLGKIELPALKEFAIRTGGLSKAAFKSIVSAHWPKIETLEVWFGSDNYGAECGVDDLAPILEAEGLPNVKTLRLMNAEFTDDIARVLVGSKILKQIEELDLTLGCLSATGAQTLKENRAAFEHLKLLDVSENTIPDEALADMNTICPTVRFDDQDPGRNDGEDRYTAVGE